MPRQAVRSPRRRRSDAATSAWTRSGLHAEAGAVVVADGADQDVAAVLGEIHCRAAHECQRRAGETAQGDDQRRLLVLLHFRGYEHRVREFFARLFEHVSADLDSGLRHDFDPPRMPSGRTCGGGPPWARAMADCRHMVVATPSAARDFAIGFIVDLLRSVGRQPSGPGGGIILCRSSRVMDAGHAGEIVAVAVRGGQRSHELVAQHLLASQDTPTRDGLARFVIAPPSLRR